MLYRVIDELPDGKTRPGSVLQLGPQHPLVTVGGWVVTHEGKTVKCECGRMFDANGEGDAKERFLSEHIRRHECSAHPAEMIPEAPLEEIPTGDPIDPDALREFRDRAVPAVESEQIDTKPAEMVPPAPEGSKKPVGMGSVSGGVVPH